MTRFCCLPVRTWLNITNEQQKMLELKRKKEEERIDFFDYLLNLVDGISVFVMFKNLHGECF